jgi:hypothetical protein
MLDLGRNIMKLKILKKSILSLLVAGLLFPVTAFAREINYQGSEVEVYVTPGEPTQIAFPGNILGGYKRKRSSIALERQENFLIVFARPDISVEGEAIIVHLDDRRSYALRVVPSSERVPRDEVIRINDDREPEYETESVRPTQQQQPEAPRGFAPPNTVAGLVREMILVAEFGKQGKIPGFRRSNKYNGEILLQDGAVRATIDEMFLGPDLWGYVVSVENLLDTTMKINPASFRLDGTRAVSAQRWELAPRPLTEEQNISNGHKSKIYIVTRSKRS